MDTISKNEAALRLELAFELFGAGCDMMEKKLRRDHPEANDDLIEQLLSEWLQTRPGAEMGDAKGVPSNRFESRRQS